MKHDLRRWWVPTRHDINWARDWLLFFLGAMFLKYQPWGWAAYAAAMALTTWTRISAQTKDRP